MSRCKSCDKILSDNEMCNKNQWGEYEELCYGCLKDAGIAVPNDYAEDVPEDLNYDYEE